MARQTAVDKTILEAALIGLEQQKAEIDAKAAEIRRRLRGLPGAAKSECIAIWHVAGSEDLFAVADVPAGVTIRQQD